MTEILEGEIVEDIKTTLEETSKSITAKGVAKFVVRNSVKFVVSGVIANIARAPESNLQRAKLALGSYVLADMVSKNTGTYVEEKLDGLKQDFQELRALVKKIEFESETPAP